MMNNELRPYEEYVDTRDVWHGKLPKHWDCVKLGMKFRERRTKVSDKEFMPLSVTKNGIVPQLSTAAKSNDGDNRKLVKQGDFVINSRSDRKGSSGLSNYNGSVSLINIVLQPYEVNSKYAHYLFKSNSFIEEFYRNGRGIVADLWTTRFYEMRNIYIPIPSLPEQDQIVKYLDNKLAKINKFIKAKKKLIAALKEQKQAIINQAVTKGMDPNVKMKPSGIEWLGDVPEHWDIVYLRNLLKPTSKKNGDYLPLLSVVREKGVILRSAMTKEENHNFIPDDLSGYKVVRTGQFVMNKMKAWQGSYGVSNHDGIVSPAYYIFDVLFSSKEYFHYAIRSKFYVNFFAQASDGIRIGQWDLSLSKMKEIPFLVPPAEEQKKIISYIPTAFMKIDESISKLNREIDLMTEYKARVVSDVVTGKVDVRNSVIDELEGIDLSDHELKEESTDDETLDFEEGDE